MNLIMLLMKCERFFRNDYSHAWLTARGCLGSWREGGGMVVERTTVIKNEDLVAATTVGVHAVTPHFFGIDYRGVLVYKQGDLTPPTLFHFLPAQGFSHKPAC